MSKKTIVTINDDSDSDVDWLVESCLAHTLSLERRTQASSSSSSCDMQEQATEERSSSSNPTLNYSHQDEDERRTTEWMLKLLDEHDAQPAPVDPPVSTAPFQNPFPTHPTVDYPTLDDVDDSDGADAGIDDNSGKTETQILMDLLDPETDTQIEAARSKGSRTRVDTNSSPTAKGGPTNKPTPPRGVIWNYKLKPQLTSKFTPVEDILENCHDLVLRRRKPKCI